MYDVITDIDLGIFTYVENIEICNLTNIIRKNKYFKINLHILNHVFNKIYISLKITYQLFIILLLSIHLRTFRTSLFRFICL